MLYAIYLSHIIYYSHKTYCNNSSQMIMNFIILQAMKFGFAQKTLFGDPAFQDMTNITKLLLRYLSCIIETDERIYQGSVTWWCMVFWVHA